MARVKYNEEVPNIEKAPPVHYPKYRVVAVSEGCRTWYEVHSDFTVVREGWRDGRFPTAGMARRVADSFNKNVEKIKSRVEVDLG